MAIFMGVMLIVLGVVVLAAPVAAGMVSVMIIGALMAAAGVVEILRAFKTQATISRLTWLVVGIVTLVAGGLVLAHPIFGLSFLTILLAIYFFTDGFVKIVAAFSHATGRGWFVTSGLLSFLLAYLIWINWPVSGGWVIGILVGVNFIFTGVLTIALGESTG